MATSTFTQLLSSVTNMKLREIKTRRARLQGLVYDILPGRKAMLGMWRTCGRSVVCLRNFDPFVVRPKRSLTSYQTSCEVSRANKKCFNHVVLVTTTG